MAALHFLPEAADLLQLWRAHAYFRAATRLAAAAPHAFCSLAKPSRTRERSRSLLSAAHCAPLAPAGYYKDAGCTELILEDVVAEGSSTNEMSIAFGNQTYGPSYDPSWQPRHWGFVDFGGKPGGAGAACTAVTKAMAEAAVNLGISSLAKDPIWRGQH